LGKSIAAFLEIGAREHLLRSYGTAALTPHTTTDTLALSREFEQIRTTGHAEDWEESTPGGVCFGAPILRPGGSAAGAISVSLPKMRLDTEEKKQRIIKAVKNAAAEISRRTFK
jgi:DNA-binding IclR family transcriptional regulator